MVLRPEAHVRFNETEIKIVFRLYGPQYLSEFRECVLPLPVRVDKFDGEEVSPVSGLGDKLAYGVWKYFTDYNF